MKEWILREPSGDSQLLMWELPRLCTFLSFSSTGSSLSACGLGDPVDRNESAESGRPTHLCLSPPTADFSFYEAVGERDQEVCVGREILNESLL